MDVHKWKQKVELKNQNLLFHGNDVSDFILIMTEL